MHPILYSFGPVTLYTYGLLVSIGFLTAFGLFLFDLKRRSMSVDTGIDFGFWVLLSAIIGSRLVYVLLNIGYFARYPLKIFMVWEGGLVWYGAFLGALATILIYFKAKKLDGWLWADVAIPYVALGQAIGRLGCLMAGCCYGRPTTLPWGITFRISEIAPTGIALHPTQIYESILNFAIFGFLYYRRDRITFRGEQILSYLFLYGAMRAVVEVFRGDPRGWWLWGTVSTSQLIGVVIVAIGIVLYYTFRERNKIVPAGADSGVRPAAPKKDAAESRKAESRGPKKGRSTKDRS